MHGNVFSSAEMRIKYSNDKEGTLNDDIRSFANPLNSGNNY